MSVKILPYDYISKKLFRACHKKRIPYRIMFELTYRCNFNCVHCYIPNNQKILSKEKELNTADIFKIIDQIEKAGCFILGFTGGEIFLREDIWEILHYAKVKGFNIILLTNGYFIDKKAADMLKLISPNKIDISLHSLNEDVFDNITGLKNSFKRVMNAIKLLRERKIPFMIKSCNLKQNKNEFRDLENFARSRNIPYRIGGDITPKTDGSTEVMKHALPAESLLETSCDFDHLKQPLKIQDIKFTKLKYKQRLFSCGVGYTVASINPFGQLKPCLEINKPQYNILSGSFKKGWSMLKGFVDNLELPEDFPCLKCNLYYYCNSCPGKSWIENNSLYTCPRREKEKASTLKKLFDKINK